MNKSNKFFVFTGPSTLLLIILGPLFVLLLDSISAYWMHTEILSRSALNLFVLILGVLVIGGFKALVVSEKEVVLWEYLVILRRVKLDKVDTIDIDTKASVYFSIGRTPSATLLPYKFIYFEDSNSKVLSAFKINVFSPSGISKFLNKIILIKPSLKLSNELKNALIGDDAKIQKEMQNIYLKNLYAWLIILLIALGVLSLAFYFKWYFFVSCFMSDLYRRNDY